MDTVILAFMIVTYLVGSIALGCIVIASCKNKNNDESKGDDGFFYFVAVLLTLVAFLAFILLYFSFTRSICKGKQEEKIIKSFEELDITYKLSTKWNETTFVITNKFNNAAIFILENIEKFTRDYHYPSKLMVNGVIYNIEKITLKSIYNTIEKIDVESLMLTIYNIDC